MTTRNATATTTAKQQQQQQQSNDRSPSGMTRKKQIVLEV
jgi:hypothetical protein